METVCPYQRTLHIWRSVVIIHFTFWVVNFAWLFRKLNWISPFDLRTLRQLNIYETSEHDSGYYGSWILAINFIDRTITMTSLSVWEHHNSLSICLKKTKPSHCILIMWNGQPPSWYSSIKKPCEAMYVFHHRWDCHVVIVHVILSFSTG